jgi:DNA ligase-1
VQANHLSVPYAALVSTFEKIERTTKRLEILGILTQFLLVVAKRDTATEAKDSNLLKVVYLCINRVRLITPGRACWLC